MSESQQQAAVVQRFRLKWPQYKIFAIPNGTHIKSHAGRKKAKKEGLLKGVSDLMVMVPKGGYHGLWIEMKDIGKTEKDVTTEQKEFIEYASFMGYKALWCIGADQADKAIDEYMGLS